MQQLVLFVLLGLCIVSLSARSFALTCAECDYVIVPATSGTYTILDNAQLGLAAGSILCYSAENTYSTAHRFANFEGTAAQPFVVTNCNGVATIHTPYHAIESNSNKHIRFTGKYDETSNETYGLRITRSAKGIDLTLGTTNVEVDHMEITGCEGHAAISVKTDPTYGEQYQRPNFVMRDVWLHHNYIHDVATEAYYVGYSTFETSTAHTIEGLRLHSNVIKRTGWDGIQVGAAIADTKVYNNYVYNYATTNTANQNSGIILLGGFKGEVYNNWVQDGPGVGILYHGNGDTSVYNNVVINANIAGHVSDSRYTPGTYTAWHHNTVINPGTNGIKVFVTNQSPTQTHHAKNNVVIGATEDCIVLSTPNNVDNNVCLATTESLFNNPAANDFAPALNSSLINTGVTCTPNVVSFDYNDGSRDSQPDVGAFEYGTKPRNDDNTGNDVDNSAASKASSLHAITWLL